MRFPRLAVLSALLLAPLPGCGDDEAPDPARTRVVAAIPQAELPRTGTIADAPRDAIEIGIAADGTIFARGEAGGLPELDVALREQTQDPRQRGRFDSSSRDVVIRASASVPWPVTVWVMQACAVARLYRLHFAVRPEADGPEGVIASWLPLDADRGTQPPAQELDVTVFANEGTADRGAVFAWLQELAQKHHLDRISIRTPPPRTPRTGHVITLLDFGLRAGIPQVMFEGGPGSRYVAWAMPAPSAPPGSLAWLRAWVTAHLSDMPPGWKVRAGGRTLDATSGRVPMPPPPPRGRAPAGVEMDPGNEPEEEEDVLAKPPTLKDLELEALPDDSPPSGTTPVDAPGEAPKPTRPAGPSAPAIDPTVPVRPFARRGDRLRTPAPGDAAPNAAIERGLAWLAAHQSPGGGWAAEGFPAWCGGKPMVGNVVDGRGKPTYDVGVTGLALLAFLGAGYTHRSEGPIGKLMGMGLKHLKNLQDTEGCIGPRSTGHFVYDHAIGALALVEAYAMTGSAIYKNSAQKALDFIALARNPYFAWRYGVKPGDNDTSVTAWMFLALDAARRLSAFDVARGLPPSLTIDAAAFDGVRAWIEKMTDPATGSVGYYSRGSGSARATELADKFPAQLVEGLTAVGVFTRLAAGETADASDPLRLGVARIAALPPMWSEEKGSIDLYSWRLCAIAMASVDGDAAAAWRKALLTALLPHQRTDGDVCGALGSWDPNDPWSPDGGRVYSTSMALLALLAPYSWKPPATRPK